MSFPQIRIFRRKFLVVGLGLIFILTGVIPPFARADSSKKSLRLDEPEWMYGKPTWYGWIVKAPGDIVVYGKETFQKKNIPMIALVVGSTVLLIAMDQYLVDKAHNMGDHLGISHTNYQKSFVTIGVPGTSKSLNIEGPFDSGSSLYFIGDGWVDVAIVGGFLAVGLTTSNNRALATSSEIAESVLASGAVVQVLKHITGRESPFTTQVSGGVWRFFPNQYRYAEHVPQFDAFPTGHLCAAMAALTVIANNYEEYTFIRPVGYTLMGVLGFQMMNNGVHWASDYPLGIALGYGFGKIAVRNGRRLKDGASVTFFPMVVDKGFGLQVVGRFGNGAKTKKS